MLILTIGLYILVELISNNVIEPWLYGSSTGMSTIAVLVAAVFWTWLWGIPGLLLATPMTVLLAVMGKYVPQLHFLSILLGDEPVLDPKTRVYQRLLAWDSEEAGELVDEFLGKRPLIELYDHVLIPALNMAEEDFHRGALDERRLAFVHQSIKDIVEDLADRRSLPNPSASQMSAISQDTSSRREDQESTSRCVLCLPAHDQADEIVAAMLSQILQTHGFQTRYIAQPALASEMVETAAQRRSSILCISAMPPAAAAHVRYLCKRLQTRLEHATFIIGLWNAAGDINRVKDRLRCNPSDQVVRTLAEAVEQITPLVQTLTAKASSKSPAPSPVYNSQ
jgi:methylmalonyl-CoA mutase cobalamin-binding subunit